MLINGIHYKGVDITRAYKNNELIWHLINYNFYSCDNTKIYFLPSAELFNSQGQSFLKNQAIPIQFISFCPVTIVAGKNFKNSLYLIDEALISSLNVSEGKKGKTLHNVWVSPKIQGHARLAKKWVGYDPISLFYNVEGYSSIAKKNYILNTQNIINLSFAHCSTARQENIKLLGQAENISWLNSSVAKQPEPEINVISNCFQKFSSPPSKNPDKNFLLISSGKQFFAADDGKCCNVPSEVSSYLSPIIATDDGKIGTIDSSVSTHLSPTIATDDGEIGIINPSVKTREDSIAYAVEAPTVIEWIGIDSNVYDILLSSQGKVGSKSQKILSFSPAQANILVSKKQLVSHYIPASVQNTLYALSGEKILSIFGIKSQKNLEVSTSRASQFTPINKQDAKIFSTLFAFTDKLLNANYGSFFLNLNVFSTALKKTSNIDCGVSIRPVEKLVSPVGKLSNINFDNSFSSLTKFAASPPGTIGIDNDIFSLSIDKLNSPNKQSQLIKIDIKGIDELILRSINPASSAVQDFVSLKSNTELYNSKPVPSLSVGPQAIFLASTYIRFTDALSSTIKLPVTFTNIARLEQSHGLVFLDAVEFPKSIPINRFLLDEIVSLLAPKKDASSRTEVLLEFTKSMGEGFDFTAKSMGIGPLKSNGVLLIREFKELTNSTFQHLNSIKAKNLSKSTGDSTYIVDALLKNIQSKFLDEATSDSNLAFCVKLENAESFGLGSGAALSDSYASPLLTQATKRRMEANNKIKNAHKATLGFDQSYKWNYPKYTDDGIGLYIQQVKKFSYTKGRIH